MALYLKFKLDGEAGVFFGKMFWELLHLLAVPDDDGVAPVHEPHGDVPLCVAGDHCSVPAVLGPSAHQHAGTLQVINMI